jgi:hypothetical protein
MFAIAHRSQVQGTTSQSFFVAVQATGEQISPQSHAALAATVETRIRVARVFGCAHEALQQALVSRLESTALTG